MCSDFVFQEEDSVRDVCPDLGFSRVLFLSGKSIKLAVDEVSVMGRSAQGVRIVYIDRPDFVIGVDRVAREEEGEEGVAEAAGNGGEESGNVEPVADAESAAELVQDTKE